MSKLFPWIASKLSSNPSASSPVASPATKSIYILARAEWTPEDEAQMRDFLGTPEQKMFWKWIEIRKAILNEAALSERLTHYIDRLEELEDLMRSSEAMAAPIPEEEQEYKPTRLENLIP